MFQIPIRMFVVKVLWLNLEEGSWLVSLSHGIDLFANSTINHLSPETLTCTNMHERPPRLSKQSTEKLGTCRGSVNFKDDGSGYRNFSCWLLRLCSKSEILTFRVTLRVTYNWYCFMYSEEMSLLDALGSPECRAEDHLSIMCRVAIISLKSWKKKCCDGFMSVKDSLTLRQLQQRYWSHC